MVRSGSWLKQEGKKAYSFNQRWALSSELIVWRAISELRCSVRF